MRLRCTAALVAIAFVAPTGAAAAATGPLTAAEIDNVTQTLDPSAALKDSYASVKPLGLGCENVTGISYAEARFKTAMGIEAKQAKILGQEADRAKHAAAKFTKHAPAYTSAADRATLDQGTQRLVHGYDLLSSAADDLVTVFNAYGRISCFQSSDARKAKTSILAGDREITDGEAMLRGLPLS